MTHLANKRFTDMPICGMPGSVASLRGHSLTSVAIIVTCQRCQTTMAELQRKG